jgi:hypothetical protein
MSGTGGVGGNSQSPYTLTTETGGRVSTAKITVANPGGAVTDEDVLAMEEMLSGFLGRRIDLPEAMQFQNQDEFIEHIAGVLDAIDNIAVNLEMITTDNGNTITEFTITDANMQNDQLDSARTATAPRRTMTNMLATVARIMAEIMATQSDMQATLALSSQQDLRNALDSSLKAAEHRAEAAAYKFEADVQAAKGKVVEGAFQIAGGLMSAASAASTTLKPLEGLGQAAGGMGRIVSASFDLGAAENNRASALENVEAEKFQAFSQAHQNMGNRMEQTANNLQQSINAINQTFKNFADAINQTNVSIASNIK